MTINLMTILLLWFIGIAGFFMYCILLVFIWLLARVWHAQKRGNLFINSRITPGTIMVYGVIAGSYSWLIVFLLCKLGLNSFGIAILIGLALVVSIICGFLLPLASIDYIYELKKPWWARRRLSNIAVAFKEERINKFVEYFFGVLGLFVSMVLIAMMIYLFKK